MACSEMVGLWTVGLVPELPCLSVTGQDTLWLLRMADARSAAQPAVLKVYTAPQRDNKMSQGHQGKTSQYQIEPTPKMRDTAGYIAAAGQLLWRLEVRLSLWLT